MSRNTDRAENPQQQILLRMDKADVETLDEICRRDKRTRPQVLRIALADLAEKYRNSGTIINSQIAEIR